MSIEKVQYIPDPLGGPVFGGRWYYECTYLISTPIKTIDESKAILEYVVELMQEGKHFRFRHTPYGGLDDGYSLTLFSEDLCWQSVNNQSNDKGEKIRYLNLVNAYAELSEKLQRFYYYGGELSDTKDDEVQKKNAMKAIAEKLRANVIDKLLDPAAAKNHLMDKNCLDAEIEALAGHRDPVALRLLGDILKVIGAILTIGAYYAYRQENYGHFFSSGDKTTSVILVEQIKETITKIEDLSGMNLETFLLI